MRSIDKQLSHSSATYPICMFEWMYHVGVIKCDVMKFGVIGMSVFREVQGMVGGLKALMNQRVTNHNGR